MNTRAGWVLCLGIIGILAVSVGAPALPTAVSFAEAESTEPPELDEEQAELVEEQLGEEPGGEDDGSFPAEWFVLGAGLIGLAVLGRVAVSNPQYAAVTLGIGIVVVALLGLLFVRGWSGSSDAVGRSVSESFPLLVAGVLATLLIVRVTIGLVLSDDAPATVESTADQVESRALTTDPHTPSRSSEFVDSSVPVDNDVYRVWQTLTEAVDKRSDETATPGDVRTVALERGFDPGTVEELTRLFEDHRYGGREPTADRERRARELLDRLRIEGERR
ncbi:DUF4129 domain-containing protein [Natronorubrum texcoconense]|uniref:Protein-glutamine gamma-glutamyltransferase-like C-terminal domain-containing protein n=1 Tax=Natronorubrum texcoconense TaxID=1095776 RepID=A0A1G9DE78_9EURY|nr:DUF4129 domain-containing protein [Natronorubrum texcoconense]SDK62137.1 protein of unknown function [Natronorubrum texcoconense]